MTIGPMPCMTCGRRVWYADGRMWSRYWGAFRQHSCRLGLALRRHRETHPSWWTPENTAAYKRDWKRRKSAAA